MRTLYFYKIKNLTFASFEICIQFPSSKLILDSLIRCNKVSVGSFAESENGGFLN